MTCIVGVVETKQVWIGGDSLIVDSTSGHLSSIPKVFKNKGFLIGWAGSPRLGQLLQYNFFPPFQSKTESDIQYLTTKFIDTMRNTFREKGFLCKERGVEGILDSDALFAYKKNLYHIDPYFAIIQAASDYLAIGSGCDVALGSLHSTKEENAKIRIEKALSAAEEHSHYVRKPFTILQV